VALSGKIRAAPLVGGRTSDSTRGRGQSGTRRAPRRDVGHRGPVGGCL